MNDNDQLSAFPMTKVETAELFLTHFQAAVDKAEKSLDTARANLMHACQLRDIAEGNLRRMRDDGMQTVAEVAAEIVNSGALDSDGLTVTATVNSGAPGVNRSTMTVPPAANPLAASPVVVVLYPGDDNPHATLIGERTRYAELIADYFTAAGIDDEVDADRWQVLAEDELTTNGGGGRNLTAPIQERDYGRRLIVAAADQGSVTG